MAHNPPALLARARMNDLFRLSIASCPGTAEPQSALDPFFVCSGRRPKTWERAGRLPNPQDGPDLI